ncbi:MAG: outer membrane protein assembly factor BamA [Nitrospirae bacterium]|nr:outer membrane protein assembly factor BamA [Nitrospirota bacterium]
MHKHRTQDTDNGHGIRKVFCLALAAFCLLSTDVYPQNSPIAVSGNRLAVSEHRIPNTEYRIPNTEYRTPNTEHRTPNLEVIGLYSMSKDDFLDILNIKHGMPLNRNELRMGIKRIFLKGIFDDIVVEDVECGEGNDKCRIKITVTEKDIIERIDVEGDDKLSAGFIKKQLGLSKGERLNKLKIMKAAKSLQDVVRQKGFPDAFIVCDVKKTGDNMTSLIVRVKEGAPEIIKEIIINEPEDTIRFYIRLVEGDIFDRTVMEELIAKVKEYYRDRGYIKTTLDYSYGNGVLRINHEIGTRIEARFHGNSAIGTRKLEEEMPFLEVNDFNADLVEEAAARITRSYRLIGHPFVQIAPVISQGDGSILVDFYIFEGERYSVDSVSFSGVSGGMQDRLKGLLMMGKGAYYNPDLINVDRDLIKEFYQALGYMDVKVAGDVGMSDGKAAIKIHVDEGRQIRIKDVRIKNNKEISEADLFKEIKLSPNNPYNEVDISEARRKITEIYNKRGFLDVEVKAEREIEGDSAVIVFNIKEGDVSFIGKTIIAGNEKTKEAVIKREFLHKEAAPLDSNVLFQERENLYRLGLFSDVEVSLSDRYKADDGRVIRDIFFKIKEGSAGAVEFGLGYGEYERYRGFFDISYKNLWGMNRLASFRTELSSLEQRFIVSYYEPWFTKKDTAFRALLLHENKREKSIDTGETRYRLRRDTATAGIEKKLSDSFKGELFYDFSVVKTSDVKPDVVLSREDIGTLIISGLRPGLIYDTRDNPFEPKSGGLMGLTLKIASSIFLSQTDFIKLTLYGNRYHSLNKWLVFAVSLRGGIAKGFGDTTELPIVERFFLGGRTTVRGYEQDMLGPKGSDGDPTGGNAFAMANLELRSYIGKGFGVVAFLDGGNVWTKLEEMNVRNLKYTSGLGLRYNTPVGPLRVDYGYKLNKEPLESRAELHFSIGHAF